MFSNKTPHDMLEKAKRELDKYERSHTDDDLFNLFITIAHIEDYVIKRPPRKLKKARNFKVKDHFGQKLYDWMKFVSNKQKHATITMYDPAIEMDQTLCEVTGNGCVGGATLNTHVVNGTPSHFISCCQGSYQLDCLARLLIQKWETFLS